jgi:amyotrophic lateral sclerosis 2 protein
MSMDDVLPLFIFLTVRARLRSFGVEVRFLEDFLHKDLLSGESHVLLTTMRATFIQLQLEGPEGATDQARM